MASRIAALELGVTRALDGEVRWNFHVWRTILEMVEMHPFRPASYYIRTEITSLGSSKTISIKNPCAQTAAKC